MFKSFKNIYIILVFVSVCLTIYFSYNILKNQYIGVFIFADDNGDFVVTDVEKDALGDRIGLEIGDIVLEINHNDPSEHIVVKYTRKLEQLYHLKVLKTNNRIVEYEINKEFDVQLVFHFIVPLIFLILSIYCSYYLHKSSDNKYRKSPIILVLFLFNIALAYLSAAASSRGDLASRYINQILFPSTPVLYLHYIYEYFKEIGEKWFSKKIIFYSYLIVLVNLIVSFLTYHVFHEYQLQLKVMVFHLLSFLILFIITYTVIGLGLKRVSYKTQRYMIRIIIISNVLAFFPFVLLYVIPYSIFGIEIINAAYLTSFLLIIPFSLVYQFVSTKVYDIEFLLGRFRYYALISIVPSIIGVVIAITGKDIGPTEYTLRTFVFFLILLFFTFIVKEILDNKFHLKRFSEKYNYKDSLFKFTKQIRKANTLSEGIDELKKVILDVLLVSEAYFIQLDRDFNVVSKDSKIIEFTSLYKNKIYESTNEAGKIVELDKGFILNIGESEKGYFLLICLSKINTPKLTVDEKSWLNALAYYTNITLSNFLKIESLMNHLEHLKSEGKSPVWYNRVLYHLEEKQRSTLAKDLHDSVLQDLISIKRKCEVALGDCGNNETSAEHHLKDIYDKLNNAILMTRETCNELRPQVLYDLGLKKALEKLVSQYKDNSNLDITLNISRLNAPEQIDLQLSIYRIVQELMANCRKHSNANKVLLMLISIKDKIVIHYEDDGIGADPNQLFEKEKSMGLSGMKERIHALNGSMDIQTEIDKGFKVIIEI